MKLTSGTAVVLGSVHLVFAHSFHRIPRQISSISRSFTGAPYPTGPGFDVPPLASITQNSTPEPTVALPIVFPAGSVPSSLGNGASGLPDLSSFDPSIYPPLDKIPPIDSPEVKAWLSEISGATIPNFQPTKDGTCASDPEAAAQAGADGRCWWTCTGCTRDTDVVGCGDRERWGLTFDDGPSDYTPKLLTYLQSIDTQATFYEVGSRVISHPATVQTQLMLGHEISVHTWSHSSMTTLTNEQVVAELGWTRKAIKDVTGVTPLTFRPPFGDIDDRVRAIANAMNLTPVIWSNVGAGKADTEDFEVPSGTLTAPETVDQFRNTLAIVEGTFDTGIITLEHDLFQETVDLAIGSTLPDALTRPGPEQRGWKLGTVAQCSGQPAGDAYQETTTNQTVLARLGRSPAGVSTTPIDSVSTSSSITITTSKTEIPATATPAISGTSPAAPYTTVTGIPAVPTSETSVSVPNSSGGTVPSVVPPGPVETPSDLTTTTPCETEAATASATRYAGVASPAGSPPAYGTSVPPGTNTVLPPSQGQPDDSMSVFSPIAVADQVSTAVDGGIFPIQNPLAPTADTTSPLGAVVSTLTAGTVGPATTSAASSTNPLSFGIKDAASNHRAAKSVYLISGIFVLITALV